MGKAKKGQKAASSAKKADGSGGTTAGNDNPSFARHAQEDSAIQQSSGAAQGTSSAGEDSPTNQGAKLTLVGRIFIFMAFPTMVGLLGLYIAHLETRKNPERKMSFDQDFVMPFLLALAMAIVIGLQTGGFTESKVKPLVAWPKVKRVKKIIHKRKPKADNSHKQEGVGTSPPEVTEKTKGD